MRVDRVGRAFVLASAILGLASVSASAQSQWFRWRPDSDGNDSNGVWHNPARWGVSTDGGVTWTPSTVVPAGQVRVTINRPWEGTTGQSPFPLITYNDGVLRQLNRLDTHERFDLKSGVIELIGDAVSTIRGEFTISGGSLYRSFGDALKFDGQDARDHLIITSGNLIQQDNGPGVERGHRIEIQGNFTQTGGNIRIDGSRDIIFTGNANQFAKNWIGGDWGGGGPNATGKFRINPGTRVNVDTADANLNRLSSPLVIESGGIMALNGSRDLFQDSGFQMVNGATLDVFGRLEANTATNNNASRLLEGQAGGAEERITVHPSNQPSDGLFINLNFDGGVATMGRDIAIENRGRTVYNGGGGFTVLDSTVINSGFFEVANGQFWFRGDLDHQAGPNSLLQVRPGSLLRFDVATFQSEFNIDGNIVLDAGSTLDIAGGLVDINGAIFGTGSVVVPLNCELGVFTSIPVQFGGNVFVDGILTLGQTNGAAFGGDIHIRPSGELWTFEPNQFDERFVDLRLDGYYDTDTLDENVASLTGTGDLVITDSTFGVGFGNGDFAFDGTIDGDGTLRKQGTGTFTLANHFLPETLRVHVAEGALNLSDSIVEGPVTLGTGSTLNAAGEFVDIYGSIDGAGQLAVNEGTLVLSGELPNANTGMTTVNDGATLILDKPAGVTSLLGPLTINSGGTAIVASSEQLFSPTADDIVTVNAGGEFVVDALEGIGNLRGAGLVTLNDLLGTGYKNEDATFTGTIEGPGRLEKHGTGTFTLTGDAVLAPAEVLVAVGTLSLENDLGEVVTDIAVGPSGSLRSAGVISGHVVNEGRISTDVSTETTILEIEGALETTGIVSLRVNSAMDHDGIDVFGELMVGGTLELLVPSDHTIELGDFFYLLTADLVFWQFDRIDGTIVNPGLGLAVDYSNSVVDSAFGWTFGVVTATAAIPGDRNLDGDVDFSDLLTLAQNYQTTGTWITGDFDGSGVVDFGDLLLLAQNYGDVPSFQSDLAHAFSSVPEPSTLLLVGGAAVLGLRRRRAA